MKNQIKLLALIILALLSVRSYSQSGNSIVITPAITAQSNAFKNLSGQNRLTEFKALQPLIITKSSKISCANTTVTDNLTTKAEVYNLLGTPSIILSPNLVAYYLSANNQSCQAVIGIDSNGLILHTHINNCP
ncbi:hypothetical protein ACFOW1_03025 [Parasediminibacterium paludis]|uniref:Uncharacterized protein n=1 Tax=Parasediminibacterium paludis TaxID=908966 RepID=A0ABV8PRR6_9BACT